MRLGGWPAQLVCTITWTSEISGSASRGMFLNDQIPASTSRSVATKTRKRFFAHQSIQRAITLHPSRGVQAELFRSNRLSILFRNDGYLPRSAAVELNGAFVISVSFVSQGHWHAHSCHTHCGHGRHEERDGHFRTGNSSTVRTGEFHSKTVTSASWRRRLG